jgi:beta-N-acetylhexosaminidase
MSIGSLMIDIQGLILTDEDKILLKAPAVGGIILFTRNYSNPQQLKELTTAIRRARTQPILIAVDQEGGRVQRFKDSFTCLPPAAWYGQNYQLQSTEMLLQCEHNATIMATELRNVGIDFSFAPVLDIGCGPSQVIGDRAFSGDPQTVTTLATAWMRGVHAVGMAAVGKHFPGHGAVHADSHQELPVDERTLETILHVDLIPFINLIQAGLDAIMPAHVLYPKIDRLPAGFSSRWLKEILRNDLHFQGVIFSDDLSMGAAQIAGGYGARALAALNAGCDMVLACNNRAGALEVAETLANYNNIATQKRLSQLQSRFNNL